MIRITAGIGIDESEIELRFIRASGPGGQNVNKVSTAVQLRFDTRRLAALGEEGLARLAKLAGRRLTGDGMLVIAAQRFRTQTRNRADAIARLVDLLRRAATKPIKRRPTKPTNASRRRRRETKTRRAKVKRLRGEIRGR